VAGGGLVSGLSRIVNVLPEFLRGHKAHSQDQKETKRYDFDCSLGKFHFCNLILVLGYAASVESK
jgi:hypothetical protein